MHFIPPPNQQQFYEQVWEVVRQIPNGRVATYGQISDIVSIPETVSAEDYRLSASRWVGLAMAACPDDVPWHRVVNAQGKISHPESGKQIKCLAQEGVYFAKGKIDLHTFQWAGPGHADSPTQGQLF